MLQNSIHKKRFHSNDENIRAKIDIARNNKIPPALNTKNKCNQDNIFNTEKKSKLVTVYLTCTDTRMKMNYSRPSRAKETFQ
jgi:hypothetical protein